MAAAPNGGVVKLAAKIARTGMAPALPDRIGLPPVPHDSVIFSLRAAS